MRLTEERDSRSDSGGAPVKACRVRLARLALALGLLVAAGCRPASVEAVHQWLTAYGADDGPTMLANTWPEDRPLLEQALEDLRTNPTSTLAMALPPRPLEHELVEIEEKAPGRHTVLTVIQMKNPLPYVSEKVGQQLPNVPKRRPERRRFLSVKTGDTWGVKLDLAAAVARVEFVAAFERALEAGELPRAKAMLQKVPAPPDEANALRTRDRLKEALEQRLSEIEAKRAERGDAAHFCFAWVHGSDSGRDCAVGKPACERLRARAEEYHRETRPCEHASTVVCFRSAAGPRCFGDARTCLEACTLAGAVTATCAAQP